ncbi:hypothetical protein NKI13_24470 [Mesorhizobium australicum]|uniref:hypothetical protein n=1 Tax=Mesorhizobium australicum TaxID=536018 RepID=UPI003335CEE9
MSRNWQDDYWDECISIAADECGLTLTKEQLDCLSGSVRSGHENYGMASGNDVASSNLWADVKREKDGIAKELHREQNMITCKPCKGSGSITTFGGTFQSTSSCWKCRGHGRHDP